MNSQEVIAALDRGDLDAGLEAVMLAAYRRKGSSRYNPSAPTAAQAASKEFRLGARVRVNARCRPQYLVGLTGTVTKINGVTVRMAFDEESRAVARRFSAQADLRCPKTLLEVI